MNLEELREIGLTQGQVSVYAAVLELGISSLNSIHEKTGIERRNIYDILNKLIEKGLVTYIIESGKRSYQCAPPERLLGEVGKREVALLALKQKMPGIRQLYELSRPEIKAEIFRGTEAIKALLDDSLRYPATYWMGGNSGVEKTSLNNWFTNWMERRAALKLWMYDLVSYGTHLQGLEPNDLIAHKKRFYRYCSLPKGFYTPMVIIIYGDRVVQLLWKSQPFAFVLESREIRESYMKYFSHLWKGPGITWHHAER